MNDVGGNGAMHEPVALVTFAERRGRYHKNFLRSEMEHITPQQI